MARSAKKNTSPSKEDPKNKKANRNNLGVEGSEPRLSEESCNSDSQGGAEETSKVGKEEYQKARKKETDSDIVVSDEGDGPIVGPTNSWARPSSVNRGNLQEEIMTQVLEDFRAKPTVKKKTTTQRVWPFFRIRKRLGWAHIDLHDAVLDGNIDIIKATIGRYVRTDPIKINGHDNGGRSALSLALLEMREDIADLIISIDETNINNVDIVSGLSPLHSAVLVDLTSSAQKLAFRGADVNATDKVGMTPLMLACRLGNASMVEMLVDVFGSELDLADKAGWTCLFYATYQNEVTIVQFLLTRGADLDHKDKRKMKAIDWGEHMGLGETCAIFEEFRPQLVP